MSSPKQKLSLVLRDRIPVGRFILHFVLLGLLLLLLVGMSFMPLISIALFSGPFEAESLLFTTAGAALGCLLWWQREMVADLLECERLVATDAAGRSVIIRKCYLLGSRQVRIPIANIRDIVLLEGSDYGEGATTVPRAALILGGGRHVELQLNAGGGASRTKLADQSDAAAMNVAIVKDALITLGWAPRGEDIRRDINHVTRTGLPASGD